MAKAGKKTFEPEFVDAAEAESNLKEMRASQGPGNSKYRPILELVKDKLTKENSIRVRLSQNEVGGLRSYLKRHLGEQYRVKSSKQPGDDGYMAFIFLEDSA